MVLFDRNPFHSLRPTPFDDLFGAAGTAVRRGPDLAESFERRANLTATDEGAHLTVLVPGFGPDDVEVRVQRTTVTVRGAASTGDDGKARRSFERSFRLPFPVDVDEVSARVEHGVLDLELPRSGADRPRIVPIAGATEAPREITDAEVE
ncbi:MAG: Hsp20/alpha crystallin family protein [Planctomycetota bacterium]